MQGKAKKRNKSVSRDARALLFYGLKSRVAFFFRYICFKKNKVEKNEKSRSEKKNIPKKSLLELANYSVKTNEHQFRSPVVSPQDYFDDIQRRSWETSDAWSNQLVHGPWQMNNLRGSKLNPWQRRHVNMPVYACIILHMYMAIY